MRAPILLAVVAMLIAPAEALAQAAAPAPAPAPADRTILVDAADRDLEAAIDQARAKLPNFWRLFDNDSEVRDTGVLKVGFRQDNQAEFMWVGSLKREGNRITGRLNNTPTLIDDVAEGQTVTVDPAEIIDWSYSRDGKAWGHFTTRVLMRRLTPAEAAEFDGYFSDTPVEP
jgi:uncharacterized protein YegJ (DUF2314 family)